MRRGLKVYIAALFWVFTIICFRSVAAQEAPRYLALITDISGEVRVKKAQRSEFEKALWGMQLYQGDRVKTLEASEVSLLFSNNSLIALGANSTLTVSEGPASPQNPKTVRNMSKDVFANVTNLTLRRTGKGEVGALAGLRSDDKENAIELLSPRNTKIKTTQPTFIWDAKGEFDKFKVKILASDGVVWAREVTEPRLDYPEDEKPLESGRSYFWQIEGERLFDSVKSQSLGFTVLLQEEFQKVEAQEQAIREMFEGNLNSSTHHFVLGAYYDTIGLWEDAVAKFEVLAKVNADSPLPHEILGKLYSNIGLKDKAIVELQKAVELSRELTQK